MRGITPMIMMNKGCARNGLADSFTEGYHMNSNASTFGDREEIARTESEEREEYMEEGRRLDALARIGEGLARALGNVGALMAFAPSAVVLTLCSECELKPEACVCDENAQQRRQTIRKVMPV